MDFNIDPNFKISLDCDFLKEEIEPLGKTEKFIKMQQERVTGFEKIGMPDDGEQLMLVSEESFNSLTFLLYILKDAGCIDELVLSFYSFSMKAMEYVDSLMESGVIKKFIFQTSFIRKYGSSSEIPRMLSRMIETYGSDRVSGSFIRSHSKVMLCNASNKFWVIEGSGNMALKVKTEQYLIENSKESYLFHKKWIETNRTIEVIK